MVVLKICLRTVIYKVVQTDYIIYIQFFFKFRNELEFSSYARLCVQLGFKLTGESASVTLEIGQANYTGALHIY